MTSPISDAIVALGTASGRLTTTHAASSYGQPVLVVDGVAYGPEDLLTIWPGIEADPVTLPAWEHVRSALASGGVFPALPPGVEAAIHNAVQRTADESTDTVWGGMFEAGVAYDHAYEPYRQAARDLAAVFCAAMTDQPLPQQQQQTVNYK